jgi:hypothetical protein
MAKIRDIKELSQYIRNSKSAIITAHTETLLTLIFDAEGLAKANATRNFTGRNGRKLSGRLLNSIFAGFTPFNAGQTLPIGYLGVRGIPYGRIHEYGGIIRPKKAKHLWLKQWGGAADKFRRMTPTEFIQAKEQDHEHFKIFRSKAGNLIAAFQMLKSKPPTPLFVLRNQVTMPERPYLRPAMDEALKKYPQLARAKIARALLGIS